MFDTFTTYFDRVMQKKRTYHFRSLLVNSVGKAMIFVFLIAFLLANVGLTVYTHVCSISGVQTSLFFDHDEMCGTDQHTVTPTSCCLAPETQQDQDHISAMPCCSTETDYVLLDIDTHVQKTELKSVLYAPLFAVLPFWKSPSFFSRHFLLSPLHTSLAQHVLNIQGRDVQSWLQVFII